MLANVLKGLFNRTAQIVQLPTLVSDDSRPMEARVIAGYAEIQAELGENSVSFWMNLQGMRDQVAVEAIKRGWASYEAPLPQLIASWSSGLPLVFVDIGANSGYYSLLSAAFGARSVIAFEPAEEIASLLDANIKRSQFEQKIQVQRVALSNKSGTSKIYYPESSHGLIETSASLNSTFRAAHDKVADVAVDTVDIALHDRFRSEEKILLKIDVEGHDMAVLGGATRTVLGKRPAIIIELLPGVEINPVTKFIKDFHYEHFSLNKNGLVKKEELSANNISWSQRDHLLLPRESLDLWFRTLERRPFSYEYGEDGFGDVPTLPALKEALPQRRIIFFLAPFKVPFGGVTVILTHVETLNRHGIAAWVALPEIPEIDFYEFDAPKIIYREFVEVSSSDICVFPEGLLEYMSALRGEPGKRIMFCQNQYYLPFSKDPARGFSEFDLDSVVVSSLTIKYCLQDLYGLADVPVIPCSIDSSLYLPTSKKIRQIAFMPRKLGPDAEFIHAAFVRMYPAYADVHWVAIHQMTRKEAAKVLSESAVFLSLSNKESFGLPPLEAMASGCVVAGFHGDGGREYMNQGNGWWADTGDWRACVHGLAAALYTFDCAGDKLADYRRRAMQTVEAYSVESMESQLLAYWRSELARVPC